MAPDVGFTSVSAGGFNEVLNEGFNKEGGLLSGKSSSEWVGEEGEGKNEIEDIPTKCDEMKDFEGDNVLIEGILRFDFWGRKR